MKGLESDLSGLNYQIEHDSKVWKREKRVYEEGKKELENRPPIIVDHYDGGGGGGCNIF